MKWTVLSDNRSCDSRLSTEHGLSILLETEQHKILLDTGASDVFIQNAELLGVDLSNVDYVFISHGHSDHAGGLRYLLERNQQTRIIVSPDAISGKFYSKRGNLHSIWRGNACRRMKELWTMMLTKASTILPALVPRPCAKPMIWY